MMKTQMIVLLCCLAWIIMMVGCAPVTLTKCYTDYKYEGDKVSSEYKECITQIPESKLPTHPKHSDLYE